MEIQISNINDIQQAANQFLIALSHQMPQPHIIAFYGKMGVGKTTFIKALCHQLGSHDDVTSPTFAIVNEYGIQETSPVPHLSFQKIFHFDFYRIRRIEEVYDMGYEDYFYSNALCLIEWPELIEDLLPDDALKVTIQETADGSRTISY